jgi:hypothetical protein
MCNPAFWKISSQLKKTANAGEELYDLDKIRKSKNPRIKVVKTTTDHMIVPIVNFILGCNHFGYSLKNEAHLSVPQKEGKYDIVSAYIRDICVVGQRGHERSDPPEGGGENKTQKQR